MTNVPTDSTINTALISLSRSFLQYVAESWPWVDASVRQVEQQVRDLATQQRQDVAALVHVLTERDCHIDFGTYPTEYTDLHFISLSTLLEWLVKGQSQIVDRLRATGETLKEAGDGIASELIEAIANRQTDVASQMKQLQQDLVDAPV